MRVLVGYATAHGSTQGIAERIAQGLRRLAIAADVRPMAEVDDLSGYDAVVLGSAIHGGNWLPEGQQFIERQSGVLRTRPVWLFSVSTLGDEESMFHPRAAERLRRMRKETPELARFRKTIGPREHRNFAGMIRRSDWPATGRAFFRAMGGRYGDHRNWAAIDAWTEQIVRALPGSPVPAGTAGQQDVFGAGLERSVQ